MSNPKTVDTLVSDIYYMMESNTIAEGVDVDAEIDRFAEGMKAVMRDKFAGEDRDKRSLRLSNIGRDDRYLWHVARGTAAEPLQANTLIKFLYGNLIEEMLLFLARLSGHSVTDEQKVCEVEGVKGHMDCRIDGVVTDVKSTSTYGFKKFKDGSLAKDDTFGYVDQLKAYAYSEGERKFGWLAMDKQNGHLTYLMYDLDDTDSDVYENIKGDIAARVRHVKKVVEQPDPPAPCFPPLPDGRKGNEKLDTGCSYCQFKDTCWPDLRVFAYAGKPRFLTKVVVEPNVPEITEEKV